MNKQELLSNIKTKFLLIEEYTYAEGVFNDGTLTLKVPKEILLDLCLELKQNKEFSFDFLMCLSGVDYMDRFEVVYHLYSMELKHKLVLKVSLDRQNPEVDSMVPVWLGADWPEREVYDMFGIIFKGHPNLKRILLPEDWAGYPLRKDYARAPDMYD
ncbi:MAG: NADH-quinone oxidoreductase subunit C [Candidatus Firestonebacteria bacterium]